MATQTHRLTDHEQDGNDGQKIPQVRELFADAPEVGQRVLEKALGVLTSDATAPPPLKRVGS